MHKGSGRSEIQAGGAAATIEEAAKVEDTATRSATKRFKGTVCGDGEEVDRWPNGEAKRGTRTGFAFRGEDVRDGD